MSAQHIIEQRILAQHRLIAERLGRDPSLLAHAKANLDRWAAGYPDDALPQWLLGWRKILGSPESQVMRVLTEGSEHAKWLRSCSPFAGALSARERWRILKEVPGAST